MKKITVVLIFLVILLQSCSLPIGREEKPSAENAIPSISPATPQSATFTPQITPSPTPKTFNPFPELMVAPEDIKTVVLSEQNDQSSAPDGFRKRFVYPIGGFGGSTGCENLSSTPFFQNTPTVFEALSADPFSENRIDTCGWAEGETVNITVTKPDGTQEISTQTYESEVSVSYRPPMEYGMQLGDYSVTFESPSGSLAIDFSVVWPSSPGLTKVNAQTYYAFGFQPGEPVFILVYRISTEDHTIQMVTWEKTTADDHGELLLDYEVGDNLLAVVSDVSYYSYWSNVFWGIFIGDKIHYNQVDPCAGAPLSRIQTNDIVYVLEGSPNNVRSSPSITADLIGTAVPGTVLYVGKKSPVCADGYLWWYVFPKTGMDPTGWTAEGKGSVYWLAPVK